MSTANQEGSGHTFFHEWGAGQEDTFTPFSRPAWWIRRVLMHMCIHKLIWATDNEFPSIHFLLTATQFQQGGGERLEPDPAVMNCPDKLRLYCFHFMEMHAKPRQKKCDYFLPCIIQIFAMYLAHPLLLPAVIDLINNAVKRDWIFKVK